MRHDMKPSARAALRAAIRAGSVAADASSQFPQGAMAALRERHLIGDAPLAATSMPQLLRLLADIGRADLSVGRIYEGHINALWLIETFGTPDQKSRWQGLAQQGAMFGVWNTDDPGEPVTIAGDIMSGRKNFASGVDGIDFGIVTASLPEGRQMVVVPTQGRPVDRNWWRPMGMRASGSHIIDLNNLQISPGWYLGAPDAYLTPPWFQAGAMRFAAVQTGGAHSIFDAVLEHLSLTSRARDPYQSHRLARMAVLVETAYLWLDRAGQAWACAEAEDNHASLIALANGARMAVEQAAMEVLELAERSVGAAGFIAPHPLERLMRDLRTYLRQPNPDGAVTQIGTALADGAWYPGESDQDA